MEEDYIQVHMYTDGAQVYPRGDNRTRYHRLCQFSRYIDNSNDGSIELYIYTEYAPENSSNSLGFLLLLSFFLFYAVSASQKIGLACGVILAAHEENIISQATLRTNILLEKRACVYYAEAVKNGKNVKKSSVKCTRVCSSYMLYICI